MKRLNEKGLTLVEILAVVVISSIMIIFTGSVIVKSMKNQERIAAEAQLRNEADVIMAGLMKDLFSLKESEIERVECGTIVSGVATPVSCMTETLSLSAEDLAKVDAAKQARSSCSQIKDCEQYALVHLSSTEKIGFITNVKKNDSEEEKNSVTTEMGKKYCEEGINSVTTEMEEKYCKQEMIITRDGSEFIISDNDIKLEPFYTVEMRQSPQAGTNRTLTSIIVTFELSNELRNITQTFQNEVIIVDDK